MGGAIQAADLQPLQPINGTLNTSIKYDELTVHLFNQIPTFGNYATQPKH